MKNKIYLASEADRISVVVALAKNQYSTRMGKEKVPGKASYKYFVEYWKEEETV